MIDRSDGRKGTVVAHALPQLRCLLCFAAFISPLGCSLSLPPVKPPRIDTAAAAEGALAEFDIDQDGTISREEARTHCVGMAESWDRYDTDGDDRIDKTELEQRFLAWSDGDTGLMNLRVQLELRGMPLTDADIRLTPFEFLGRNVLPATGTTDQYGYAFMAIPKDLLPDSQQATHGMQVGLYRVSITHPTVKLAQKYNQKTELSADLSAAEANTGIHFRLR